LIFSAATLLAATSRCQTADPASGENYDPGKPPEPADKRILWIIPNYRTFPSLINYEPISPKEKFKIAAADSFDRGTVVLAAAFGGAGSWKTPVHPLAKACRGTHGISGQHTAI
jgi:hypothetical protein